MNQITIEQLAIGVLVLFSIVTWALALIKIAQCWNAKRLDRVSLAALGEHGEVRLSDCAGAVARLVQRGTHLLNSTHVPAQAADRLEHGLHQQIRIERRRLDKGLPVLASIASTSPFIGLFGTVWGIMEALKGISAAGNASLDTVAGPVGSALIATGIGIAVAVPAVLFYNGLLRATRNAQARWEDAAYQVFDHAQQQGFHVEQTSHVHKEV